MIGYRASGKGLYNLFNFIKPDNECFDRIKQLPVRAGACDKNPFIVDIGSVLQPVLHILPDHLFKASPVFLPDVHLAVNDLDTRFQLQKVSAQRRDRGAAAALVQIFQGVDDKAGL